MKLDKALQHRWAGKDIKREGWKTYLADPETKAICMSKLTTEDIDADDWEVVPKYVHWTEACAALVNGKEIIADWEGNFGEVVRKVFALNRGCTGRLYSRDKERREWGYRGDLIPIKWLTATNFEILED